MATDVASSLPQLDLDSNAIVTVEFDDPAVIIEQLTVHGWQDVPGVPPDRPLPVLTLEELDT